MDNNDYVKVVRCKNCKYYAPRKERKHIVHECANPQWWDAEFGEKEIEPEAFCSYGEERCEEEGE